MQTQSAEDLSEGLPGEDADQACGGGPVDKDIEFCGAPKVAETLKQDSRSVR